MAQKKPSWEEQKKAYEQRKSLYWEDMEVGREFEPFVLPITKVLIDSLMQVTGDKNPLYYDEEAAKESPYRVTIAPQAANVIFGRLSYLGDTYRPAPGGIVTSLSYQFIKPPRIGDVVTSRAKVVGKEERKGRKYFSIRAESVNQNLELVSVMEQTGILPQ